MSEKLEDTFELPVDQELLDTSILESMKAPTLATENDEKPVEKPQLTRSQHQETGKRIMDAARYLPSGPIDEPAAADLEEVSEEVMPTHYDIVVERATQALGPAQFENLVKELEQSARKDAPDITMEKFRAQAGSSMVDAGELWEAILVQAKQERFGDEKVRQGVKFYYGMPLEEFRQALQAQKLERTDGQGNALASNLHLAADTFENGKWHSGFDAAQGEKTADVTLVFDGEIIDQDDFIALSEQPTVSSIDLKDRCLGAVFAGTKEQVQAAVQILADSELYMLPSYLAAVDGDKSWGQNYYSVEWLRNYKESHMERAIKKEQLRREVFVDVDHFEVARTVRMYAQKISVPRMIALIDECQALESQEDYDSIDIRALQMLNEALDLGRTPEVKYFDDPESEIVGLCTHRPRGKASLVELNRGRIDGSDLRESFGILSHEAWHDHQRDLEDCLDDENLRRTLSPAELHRAELYQRNYQSMISPKDDIVGYRSQLIEMEARSFEAHVLKIFDRAYREQRKLSHKLKRGVENLQNSFSTNGKRVATKADLSSVKAAKKPRGGKRLIKKQEKEAAAKQEEKMEGKD